VALGSGITQVDSLGTSLLRRGNPALLPGHVIHVPVGFTQACFSRTVVRVKLQRLFENRLGAGQGFRFGSLPQVAEPFHEVLIRFRQSSCMGTERLALVATKVDVERIGDAAGEFIFDSEEIGDGRGDGIAGQVFICGGVDQVVRGAKQAAILF